LRIRKSITLANKTDQQIPTRSSKTLGSRSSTREKSITKARYQHNQNGLEFTRTRAARMGCHMWC
jgi:hypothetical protein